MFVFLNWNIIMPINNKIDICVFAHGIEESVFLDIRMGRNLREGSLRSLMDLEKSFRQLESTGIIPRGYVRYMNDMIITIERRIFHRM
jgi:hypothetical protein